MLAISLMSAASSPGKSPSKRFSTTTNAALTGHSFDGQDVPGSSGDPLNHRIIRDKNRFQKGSISFGHEKVGDTLFIRCIVP